MNNILKKTVSGVVALGIAVTSVQVSVPHVHTGHAEEAAALVATGVKGDANADGVVNEADLDVYESYLLGNTEIAEDILEDMDIDYGNTYQYVEVNGNDYAAVRNYLEGCTQTIEPSGHIQYRCDGGIHTATLYAGYNSSNAVYINEADDLTNSTTEHEITEIIWDGGKPDWATEVEREGGLYIDGTPDETDVGTYNMLIVGKDLSGKYHAIANDIEVCLPDYKVTTEDGNIIYEGGACSLFGPGTYNITSSMTDVSDMIMIVDIGQPGKYVINLNGMNVNYGDALSPGDFIQFISLESNNPTADIDLVLSGSNVIRNGYANLYTEGQVNIYGDDDDTLSLLGNSCVNAREIKVNGGNITVKSNYYQAMTTEKLTLIGGSLDLSFSPVEGQQWDTSNTSLTGVGLLCDEVIIRRGNLLISGNDGAVQGIYSTPKFYVSPLYCDIDIDVSDDGNTYTAIEGSPFSDPDNAPSAYTGAEGTGTPNNSIDISNYIANKNFIKIATGFTYSYKVTIDAGEHGNVTYEDDTANQKSFWVAGGEKLPEGITLTTDEGWEIDKITASVNGALPVNVTDISEIVINGDTVINITTKDIKAPVINGITDGSKYCGTITFTVTDDSNVSVTIEDVAVQPDENGVYTIVGDTSSYGIKATDAFGNETIYVITVYTTHPSTSNHRDNGDGTHTGVCDFCREDVIENHNFGDWLPIDDTTHEKICEDCGFTKTDGHIMGDWQSDNGDTHSRECSICHHPENKDHTFGEWTDNHESGKCERECETCGHVDEAEHDFGDWEDIPESGQHKRECENCGHTETGDHNFDNWTPHLESNTHRAYCEDCGLLIVEPHSMGECEEYDDLQHITRCEDCAFFMLADHTYSEWTDNHESGKHERECEGCGHSEEADHVFGEWTDNHESGKHERECAVCGHTEEADHVFGEWTDNHESGKHERECEVCGHTEEADHVFGEWTDSHESGKHERECTVCGHTEEADHVFGEWTDNHESGKHERECTVCGHTEEADHVFGEWTDNHESGKCERECKNCGHTEESEHIFGEWTDNHESGKCERECENCGHTEESEHIFGEWTDNHESGKHERVCEICGHTEESEHIFGEWTDNHESGKCERECEICGHTEESEHIFSNWESFGNDKEHKANCTLCGHTGTAEHTFGKWTEEDDIQHKQECEDCGFIKTEEHKFDNAVNIGSGQHKLTCSVCGAEMTEDCYGIWETTKEATCTKEGTEEMICEVCGEKHTRAIEKLPHEFINGRCSSCYFEDPAIGDSSTNPPTGMGLGAGLATLIPVSALIFFARPKAKKDKTR